MIKVVPYTSMLMNFTPEQEQCFQLIVDNIDQGIFVDVENYEQYLYDYVRKVLYDVEKDESSIPGNERLRRFLSLYRNKSDNTNLLDFSLFKLLFLDLYECVPKEQMKSDYEMILSFVGTRTFLWRNECMAAFYIYAYSISEMNDIPAPLFFLISRYKWENYLTDFGKQNSDSIRNLIGEVLKEDYLTNGINFIYRLYTIKKGSIYADYCTTNEELDSFLDEENDFTLRQGRGTFCVENMDVPERNERKQLDYISIIVREAENRFRQKQGLPRVGEGWISESELYRRMEAAFPNETVLQHAHPAFLGLQHYDVYFPDYKIAIEYQGIQHFEAVDLFGGDEALINRQKLDERKRLLSKENGVELIEVLPDYDLEQLLRTILDILANNTLKYTDIEKEISDALLRANSIERNKGIILKSDIQQELDKKELKNTDDSNFNLLIDEEIAALVAKKTPNPKTQSFNNVTGKAFDKALKQYEKIEKLRKTNPSLALEKGLALIEDGTYAAPAIYGCLAIILRSQKKYDEEFDLLLQMKRDFGYLNYDDRIRNLYKKIR